MAAPDTIDPEKIVEKDGKKYYPVDGKLVELMMIDENFDKERAAARKKMGLVDDTVEETTEDQTNVAKILTKKNK